MNHSLLRAASATYFAVTFLQCSLAIDVYVDFFESPPSSTFSGAAAIPGYWNSAKGNSVDLPLLDISQSPSSVTVTVDYKGPSVAGSGFNNPATTGDIERLLDDGFSKSFQETTTVTFSGLPASRYSVITYARHPNPSSVASVFSEVVVNSGPVFRVEGQSTWDFSETGLGTTFARHLVDLSSATDLVVMVRGASDSRHGNSYFNGIQIIEIIPEPTSSALALATLFLATVRRRYF